jgi:SAM-dependent methyltransferase
MKKVDKCIICRSDRLRTYDAETSPFIAERIWGAPPSPIKLLECEECEFFFFEARFDDEELRRLYAGYRGGEYQKQRLKFEPDYTEEKNRSIGGEAEVETRNKACESFLVKNADLDRISSVLDYGGGKGQFIVDGLSKAEKYVYEISGETPLDGLVKLNTLEECRRKTYDLILCQHVLEHVPDLHETISNIKSLMRKESLVYIEVPLERPLLMRDRLGIRRGARRFLLAIPPLASLFRAIKRKAGEGSELNRAMSVCVMHEHINMFTPKALERLVRLGGLEIMKVETNKVDFGSVTEEVIRCLAVMVQ